MLFCFFHVFIKLSNFSCWNAAINSFTLDIMCHYCASYNNNVVANRHIITPRQFYSYQFLSQITNFYFVAKMICINLSAAADAEYLSLAN